MLRSLGCLILAQAAVSGCVLETDLARRDSPEKTADAGGADVAEDASSGMGGMAGGMGGPLECDGHDCEASSLGGE